MPADFIIRRELAQHTPMIHLQHDEPGALPARQRGKTEAGQVFADTFGIPRIQQGSDYLEIKLPKFFRDDGWANSIGLVQYEISRYSSRHLMIPRKILFNFNSCRWIDPFPLMSVLLEIANALHIGMTVKVKLPEYDSGSNPFEQGPYQKSPNRLLLFLAQEGFINCLDDLKCNIEFLNRPDGWIEVFRSLPVRPSYEDARCIPMKIFDVPTEEINDFAKTSVEGLLVGIESILDSKIPPHSQEQLIYKLRVALQEVLHNAQEHAYEEDASSRLLSVYVRFRNGGIALDSASRQVYQQCVREENTHCPKLRREWLNVRPGCLEVFVLDRGIGMVRSFEKVGIELPGKYKFSEVMKKTFLDGRSTRPKRQTRYGGLHLLHNLLTETGDYLRGLEDNIWFGCGVPIHRSTEGVHQLAKAEYKLIGLAIHLRMGWKEETDHGDEWGKFAHAGESEIWHELALSEHDCAPSFEWFESQYIFDDRFGELKKYGSQSDWILWLVRPHQMKRDILIFIERNIAPIVSKNTVLIIADITSYEAQTYAAALGEFKTLCSINWPTKFSRIIFSTNRWRFAAVDYKKHGDSHGFSALHNNLKTLRITPLPIKPEPKSFRLGIVRWLKWHDSRRLWDEVEKNRQMFVSEQISWGKDEIGDTRHISGYLDFHRTTHNSLCSAIYKISLTRLLGILPPEKIELHPLDRLTKTILREVHSSEMYRTSADLQETQLALGSVLVSGSTLQASSSFPLDLHFLIHHSSPLRGKKPSLLYWLPKDQVGSGPSRFSRIGRTAAIAPEGWKSFEVPRFDSDGECVGARSPQETYQDWQSLSPVIVKAGHWSYEGHHDFLTINIAKAVEASFLAKNELAHFLVNRILPFIGLDKTHLNEDWHLLLETEPEKHAPADHGLLVYRSHPSSDLAIKKLFDILTEEGRKIALSRTFPILPVRMRWTGSTFLIPPFVREDIKNALFSGPNVCPILLFDDAAITGRTLHDLQAALLAVGAEQISIVVVVNRLRQPADSKGNGWLDYYWRLDVPAMGREGNCPLCHALNLAESFSASLVSSIAIDSIKKWRRQWGEVSPLNNWSAGIHPMPLITLERQTKYCYRRDLEVDDECKKYFARIDIIRSSGLVAHITELHAMTGRDDYCIKKIIEHNEHEIRIEIASSQILLFGSEFDMDVRLDLVVTLIRELAFLKEGSPHASLAVLVSMSAMSRLGLLDKEAKIQAAKAVYGDEWGFRSNYLMKVLLSFLVAEKFIEPNTAPYKLGKGLLSTASWPLSRRLNEWFLETLSPRGNAHSEAIPLLIEELTQPVEIADLRIKDAIDSLYHLEDIIGGLDRGLVRKEFSSSFKDRTTSMKSAAEEARDLLSQRISKGVLNGWNQKAKDALEKYVNEMKHVANGYFHLIPSAQNYWKERTFETKALSKVIDRIDWKKASENKLCDGCRVEERERKIEFSQTGIIDFDSNAREVWIVWHRGIAAIIRDLLQNAVYAGGEIMDPWDSKQDMSADMWVRVNYEKKFVDLTLANSVKCNPTGIYKKLKNDRWSYLVELGGTVKGVEIERENIAGLQVKIPYAAYLGS